MDDRVFVFGSDLSGRHAAGAALHALQVHGAVYGQGLGRQGNAFAIPTRDKALRPLTLGMIEGYVYLFLTYAAQHPDTLFELSPISCELDDYDPEDIAPLFATATPNVLMPPCFVAELAMANLEADRIEFIRHTLAGEF